MKRSCFKPVVLSLAFTMAVQAKAEVDLTLHQVLQDQVNAVDGLDNPRDVLVLEKLGKVLVTSADDNSIAEFSFAENKKLMFNHVVKNSALAKKGLEGATSILAISSDKAAVTGFYDSAVNAVMRNYNGNFTEISTTSDGLDYKKVFSGSFDSSKDTYGLLGAWGLAKSVNDSQLFVASYVSDAISMWQWDQKQNLSFIGKLDHAQPLTSSLGKPVALAFSDRTEELFVTGFEGHQLTVFNKQANGQFKTKQVLSKSLQSLENCLNPQDIVVSPNDNFVILACSGSGTLVSLINEKDGWQVQQVIDKKLLNGASTIALSRDGSKLFVAGETGQGIHIFAVNEYGQLSLTSSVMNSGEPKQELNGISSLTLSHNDTMLFATTAKADKLFVFEVVSR